MVCRSQRRFQITDMALESKFKVTHTKTCLWLKTQIIIIIIIIIIIMTESVHIGTMVAYHVLITSKVSEGLRIRSKVKV